MQFYSFLYRNAEIDVLLPNKLTNHKAAILAPHSVLKEMLASKNTYSSICLWPLMINDYFFYIYVELLLTNSLQIKLHINTFKGQLFICIHIICVHVWISLCGKEIDSLEFRLGSCTSVHLYSSNIHILTDDTFQERNRERPFVWWEKNMKNYSADWY